MLSLSKKKKKTDYHFRLVLFSYKERSLKELKKREGKIYIFQPNFEITKIILVTLRVPELANALLVYH